MKILIAEDDPIQQELATFMMDMWNFEFDLTSNGQEAVELAKKNDGDYDLCLMDINMPIMDGCEAVQLIRHKTRYFPIMAVSAHQTFKARYLKIEVDDFFKKPYDPLQLYNKINELTVKFAKLYHNKNKLCFKKETPMNQEELQELIKLKEKGLTKLKLIGTQHTFIVHKNIQNKISYDLVGQGKELSEFIDRCEQEPGQCHLYKSNLYVTKSLLIPSELEDAIQKENEIATRCSKVTDKKIQNKDKKSE